LIASVRALLRVPAVSNEVERETSWSARSEWVFLSSSTGVHRLRSWPQMIEWPCSSYSTAFWYSCTAIAAEAASLTTGPACESWWCRSVIDSPSHANSGRSAMTVV
jgi:hypothetical protein